MKLYITFIYACCTLFLLNNCNKKEQSVDKTTTPTTSNVASLSTLENKLGQLPNALFRANVSSPIHWQTWSKETLALAKQRNQPMMVAVALPESGEALSYLQTIEKNATLVNLINSHFIPVLIDASSMQEWQLYANRLTSEINKRFDDLGFYWLSPDAIPLSVFVEKVAPEEAYQIAFEQQLVLLKTTFIDDPDYIKKNARMTAELRKNQMDAHMNSFKLAEEPIALCHQLIRKVASFYDNYSHQFDGISNHFSYVNVNLLNPVSLSETIPASTRNICKQVTQDYLNSFKNSSAIDPLTGAIFTKKQQGFENLPFFHENVAEQAQIIQTLFLDGQINQNPLSTQLALRSLKWLESQYKTPEGLFAIAYPISKPTINWLWETEEIQSLLGEDASWWIEITNMKPFGNILAISPKPEFYKKNTLSVSTQQNIQDPRFQRCASILLKKRNEKLNITVPNQPAHAATTFAMVSAYAAAYTATHDSTYQQAAIDLLYKAKNTFIKNQRLYSHAPDETILNLGRANLYARAALAAVDVANISHDTQALNLANELLKTFEELFIFENKLNETSQDQQLIQIHLPQLLHDYANNTRGIAEQAYYFLNTVKDSQIPSCLTSIHKEWHSLPNYFALSLNAYFKYHSLPQIKFSPNVNPNFKALITKLPLRLFVQKSDSTVPENEIHIQRPDQPLMIIRDYKELENILLHPSK